MRKRVGIALMFLTCLLLTFVLNQRISYAPTSTEIIKNERDGSEQTHRLEDQVQYFYFGQEDETGSNKIVDFKKGEFPHSRSVYAIHKENAYILLDVVTSGRLEQVEELFAQIQIEGNATYSTTVSELEKDKYELRINLQSINNGFVINFANLPPIVFKKMAPLAVKVVQDPDRAALLLNSGSESQSFLYITNKQEAVTLRFSEQMVDRENIGPAPLGTLSGKWLDEQTYRLYVGPSSEDPINLQTLYSLNGNYLPSSFEQLQIRRVPEREWIDYQTGKPLGGDKFATYYDQIIYAPNKEKYVGIVDIGRAEGDSPGNYYAYVLEQPGMAPTLVESAFYTIPQKAQVQWIDNDRLLYAAPSGVLLYDSKMRTKKQLYTPQANEQGSILEAAYDNYAKKLYLLLAFQREGKEQETNYVEKWVYDYLIGVPSYKYKYSPTGMANKYELQQLPIHMDQNNIYWTILQQQNKQVMTVKQSRSGDITTVPGEVVTADGKGNAYLLKPADAEGKPSQDRYYYWEKGKQPRLITKRTGTILPFGASLVAIDKERYFQYDPASEEWIEIQLYGRELYLPPQEQSTYYRRLKNAGRPANL